MMTGVLVSFSQKHYITPPNYMYREEDFVFIIIVIFICRVIEMNVKKGTVELKNLLKPNEVPKVFTYDAVYDWK